MFSKSSVHAHAGSSQHREIERERERESKKERKKERKKEFKNMSCERGGAIPFVAFSHAKSQRLTYRQLDVRYPAQFLQSHDHFWERRAKK